MKRAKRTLVHMSLKVEPELRETIARAARTQGRTVSDVVRDAVKVALGVCPACGRGHDKRPSKAAA